MPSRLGLHLIERQHRLREQIDGGLAAAAFEAQMESGRDSIERDGRTSCQVVSVGGRMLEEFRGREIFAAIELLDRRIELGIHAITTADYESIVSPSSTTRNSVSLSGLDLREPYFSYISNIADLCGRTLPSGHLSHSSSDSSQ